MSKFSCPNCHNKLKYVGDDLICLRCEKIFNKNEYGYLDFIQETNVPIDSTTDEYAKVQSICGPIVYNQFIKHRISEKTKKILEVGCGIGLAIPIMNKEGYEAYGIDLPGLSPFWKQYGNNHEYFFCADATKLPFPDEYFDLVYSFGVIEHIGTIIGHCTLDKDYLEKRSDYVEELLRVTKKNGKIMISCPNKSFPIDLQHGPMDELSPKNNINKIRQYIHYKLGINVHKTIGKYHLLSYSEVNKLFTDKKDLIINPIPLKGFFCFYHYKKGLFSKIFVKSINIYFNNLPKFLRSSFLNPYLLVEIIKK